MKLPRLDYLKIDVENMEEKVLSGEKNTIKKCKPIIQIEILKSDSKKISDIISKLGYTVLNFNDPLQDFLCVPTDDPVLKHLSKK